METKKTLKLTEEQKQKIISVLNDLLFDIPEEPVDPEYITEYDMLMEKKEEEFKLRFLQDDYPDRETLIEVCDDYLNGNTWSGFGLVMLYDMWINECPFWPTNNPELWNKWEGLKKIKIKKRENNEVSRKIKY